MLRSYFPSNMGFCVLCNVESIVLRALKEGNQKPEAGSLAPELWTIIEPLAPGNNDRQDPIQKDTYLHWKKAPSKSRKLQCKTTHANLPAKQEHTQENDKAVF